MWHRNGTRHTTTLVLATAALGLATTAASGSQFSRACGVPDRNVETVQVVWEGRGADDPENYSRGWFSMRTTDSEHVMPWGGNSHNSQGNNSIRFYDVRTNTWQMVHPNVGSLYDKKSRTWSEEAYKRFCPGDTSACKIVTNRDNHIQWFIPDRHEMVIMGKPAGDVMFGGVYDVGSQRWTVDWTRYSDVGTQGFLEKPAGLREAYSWGYNAAQAWVDPDGPGGSPGVGLAYGGNVFSTARDWLWKLQPSKDSRYRFRLMRVKGNPPGPLSHNRNGAIGAGSCFYMFGGAHRDKTASNQVWRYNVTNGKWTRMAPMPNASMWNAAAFDPATNLAVVVTGTSPAHVLLYDLERNSWQDISSQVPLPGVSQPAMAHAYGRYVVMGRQWDDNGDGHTENSHVNRIYRFIVAAKTYRRPRIKAVEMPGGTKSNSYNRAPAQSAKHMSWAYDPNTQRYYSAGGDFGGTPGFQSYRQEIWSWAPKTDTWTKELPYCVPDGQISWLHPDPIGWDYDPSRKGFWFTPGMMPKSEEECKTGKYYQWQVLFFNPATRRFSRPKQPPGTEYPGSNRKNGLGGDPIYHSVYLPKEDALLRIGSRKVAIFHIKDGTWEIHEHNGPSFPHGVNFRFARPQLVGRDVYLSDANRHGSGARLFRYNLDDRRLHLVGKHTWGGVRMGRSLVSFPSWTNPSAHDMSVYDLVTGTIATVPVRTPDVMESTYGTSWAVSRQRREMFVFGQQKPWGTWFSKFYLIDLSFLPPAVPNMGRNAASAGRVERNEAIEMKKTKTTERPAPRVERRSRHRAPARRAESNRKRETESAAGVHLPPPGRVIINPGTGKPYNLPQP
ncbi:MAG: kelch repeat-containing protein [Gammaproteobacteria bacterium]